MLASVSSSDAAGVHAHAVDSAAARVVLERYLSLDLDFGISGDDLQRLFRECDMGLGEEVVSAVFSAFPKTETSKTLNALDFIEGFALLASGSFEEKAELAYDIFDFQKRAEISFDELVSGNVALRV